MRVWIYTYACEPDSILKPETGWQIVLYKKLYADELWVLTSSNNRGIIEANHQSHILGLHSIDYDLPKWAHKLKKQFGSRRHRPR
jgi:hypothetical protein